MGKKQFGGHCKSDHLTWKGCVTLPSFGTNTVVPAHIRAVHKVSKIHEEVLEGHVGSLERDVVQQGSPPQEGVLTEQDGVERRKTLLCGIEVLQAQVSALTPWPPHLVAIVDAPQVVGTWERQQCLFPSISILEDDRKKNG